MLLPAAAVAWRHVHVAAAVALFVLVLAPIRWRVELGFRDRKRPSGTGALVAAYDLLWTGALFGPLTSLLAAPLALVHRFLPLDVGVGVGFALGAYGVLVRRRWTRVRRVEVAIPRLPRAFDGYRIVQLSDLHVGTTNRAPSAMRWTRTTNALDADLVAVTGDLVTSGTAFHDEVLDVLGGLRARDGVVGCLGNHDYYGEDALCVALGERGVRMLRNRGIEVRRGDDRLFIAGVEDAWRGSPDLDAALRGANGASVVLLAHNPDYFPVAREAGVSLTLSGHTHAGQVGVPFFVEKLNLSLIATRWSAGVYRDGDALLFVHAGLGTTGPAIRIGAAPEIVEIVLRAG